jgi:hypothetical protein
MAGESSGTSMTKRDQPRAFYPDYTESAPARRTPAWDLATERQLTDGRTMARGLAWFSIGLGLLEVFAPAKVTEFLGVDEEYAHLVRMYGLREMASGVAILAERTPVAGVWSRVGGDALDVATLAAFSRESSNVQNVMVAIGMVAGIAALDIKCAMDLAALPDADGGRRRAA